MAGKGSTGARGQTRRPREQWEKLVRKYERSRAGLTQVQFAREQGLKLGTLRYWMWKLRGGGRGRTRGRTERSRNKSEAAVEFVEVTSASPVGRAPCRVLVGRDVAVELDSLPPAEWIRQLAKEA